MDEKVTGASTGAASTAPAARSRSCADPGGDAALGLLYKPYRAASPLYSPRAPSEAEVTAAANRWSAAPEHATHKLIVAPGVIRTGVRPWEETATPEAVANASAAKERDRDRLGAVSALETTRGSVRGWSQKSRANMTKTLAELDYSELLAPGTVPIMVTLTLPGDWVTVAPTPARFKELVKAFRKSWQRRWGSPLSGVWKLEFQRRGAPHLHVLTVVPASSGFSSWIGPAWAAVVRHPDPEQRSAHERAGTGVDSAKGHRGTDPRRIAVYFSKHGSYGDKAYQDKPPEEWEGATGRIWGYWGLKKATAEVPITEAEAIQIQRVLRRLEYAKRVRVQRPVWRRVRPEIIDLDTGEVLQEARYRKRKTGVRMGAGRGGKGAAGGGFSIVNDGIATSDDLRRYIELLRRGLAG